MKFAMRYYVLGAQNYLQMSPLSSINSLGSISPLTPASNVLVLPCPAASEGSEIRRNVEAIRA